jgi:uncharacterized protein with HEPN domain
MRGANADQVRLLHILEAITYIESFLNNKVKQDLYDDHLVRFAVERQLEIIGEDANHIDENLKLKFPDVEWRRIVGFRNFLAHEYFGIDLELVWDIVNNKIPRLKILIQNILSEIHPK